MDNLPGDAPYTITATVSDAALGYVFAKTFGTYGSGDGQFRDAHDVAIDLSGNIWVVDYGNSRIEEFTGDGTFLQSIGGGTLCVPYQLALDRDGNIWVSDNFHYRIVEFSRDGGVLRAFGSRGSEDGQFTNCSGMAFDSAGNLWVSDGDSNNRIQEFTPEGTFLQAFGRGELNYPTDLTIDSTGNIWVADSWNHRVVEFSSSGELLTSFGTFGTENGQFDNPVSIAIDSSGHIWVADIGYDAVHNRIMEFTSAGTFIQSVGGFGSEPGQLYWPFGITFDSSGNLWVADTFNHRIQEFAPTGGGGDSGTTYVTVNNVAPTMTISGPDSVDEGSVYTLTLGPVVDPGTDAVSQYLIHWGDGIDQTILPADLPGNRQVPHTYADGPSSPTITVDLTDEDGTYLGVASKAVTVNNVAPFNLTVMLARRRSMRAPARRWPAVSSTPACWTCAHGDHRLGRRQDRHAEPRRQRAELQQGPPVPGQPTGQHAVHNRRDRCRRRRRGACQVRIRQADYRADVISCGRGD